MRYIIVIGEYAINDEGSEFSFVAAKRVTHVEAPLFPNDTSFPSNNTSKTSITWYNFCENAGLLDMFYESDKQIRGGYPGYFDLTSNHLMQVQNALTNRRLTNNGKPPGYAPTGLWLYLQGNNAVVEYDGVLAKLIWLEWWIRWALLNCSKPIVSIY